MEIDIDYRELRTADGAEFYVRESTENLGLAVAF